MLKRTLAAVIILLAGNPLLVYSNDFVVNTTTDAKAFNPSNGSGEDVNGNISLRSALETADYLGGTHTITLSNGTYTITLGQIIFGTKPLNITITGNGVSNTIIDMTTGATKDRIFLLNPTGLTDNVVLSVTGVKFQNGYLTEDHYGGAAIAAGGGTGNSLTLTNCAFENNIVPQFFGTGGAINQVISGDLTITNCTFTNNQDNDADGGAVYFYIQSPATGQPAFTGNLLITGSTFSGNSTTNNASGGAIAISASGNNLPSFTVSIQKNTFLNNIASGNGGAIAVNSSYGNSGNVDINFNRFVGNSSFNAATSAVAMFDGSGDVDATNNWWGCNSSPDVGGNCDRAAVVGFISQGMLSTDPWLQLKATAEDITGCPNNIPPTVVTAGFLTNSANAVINVSNLSALVGLPVNFVNPALGTLSNADVNIQPTGTASVTFTSDGNSGTGSVNAIVDNVPGNDVVAKASFNISVDNATPTITCPPPVNVQCASMVPQPDINQVTSNATVSWVSDMISNQDCTNKFTITRTYRAVDVCGNSSTCTQTITVNDDTAPVITAPPNTTVSCSSLVPANDFTGGTSSDNCGTVTVSWVNDEVVDQSCTNRYTILRKYKATDACNNSTEAVQTITVSDNLAPVISCPANLTVQCASNVPPTDFAGGSASDNCGTVTVSWVSDIISGQSCTNRYSIARTYKAVDACGNEANCTQTITVNDNIAPVINGCVNIEVNPDGLSGTVVNYNAPTATDNCGIPTVSFVSGLVSGSTFPIGVTTIVYKAEDACGNISTCSFTVTVRDPSCGSDKVYVCHGGNTLCISRSALNEHLQHGDLIGPCSWYNFSRINTAQEGTNYENSIVETVANGKSARLLPAEFRVSNFPNPVNSETRIYYELPEDSRVSIILYDVRGTQVKTIANANRIAGTYSEVLYVGNLTNGIYYYKFIATGKNNKVFVKTRKISVVK